MNSISQAEHNRYFLSPFQKSGEGCDRAAAAAGDHQQPSDDGCALRQEPRLLRRLELRHDLPRLIPGVLRIALLLLSQRRGTKEGPPLAPRSLPIHIPSNNPASVPILWYVLVVHGTAHRS